MRDSPSFCGRDTGNHLSAGVIVTDFSLTDNHHQNHVQNKECRRDLLSGTASISIYIHIPFCVRKCSYCDFLSGPRTPQLQERYVQALIREIGAQRDCPSGTPVDTIFFGGGTPSVLSAGQIGRIMEALREQFFILADAEISMEMNPGTADADQLSALKKNGLNRLSIGVQSMHDEELRLLGRIHCAAQARQAFDMAREAGFDNINIDLMSALPGQTFETWADSLRQAVEWKPEHISAYSLIIEPGTPFSDLYDSGKLPALPDEETDRSMYHYTRRFLAQHGYERYEISNYALPGRECRHNTGYWTGHPYLGFGIGAASYVNGTRFSNTADFEAYLSFCEDDLRADNLCKDDHHEDGLCEDIRTDVHVLSQEEKMEEFMFLGLRMTAGVSGADFASRFHKTLDEAYGPVIRRHVAQGLLQPTADGFCLTERGTDVSNYVMADYLM